MKKVMLAILIACVLSVLLAPAALAAGPPDKIEVTTYEAGPPEITTDGSGPPSEIIIKLRPCGAPFAKDVINVQPSISPAQ